MCQGRIALGTPAFLFGGKRDMEGGDVLLQRLEGCRPVLAADTGEDILVVGREQAQALPVPVIPVELGEGHDMLLHGLAENPVVEGILADGGQRKMELAVHLPVLGGGAGEAGILVLAHKGFQAVQTLGRKFLPVVV